MLLSPIRGKDTFHALSPYGVGGDYAVFFLLTMVSVTSTVIAIMTSSAILLFMV